jgi:prophage antirepressor-like protein
MSEIFEYKYLEGKNEEGYYIPLQNANIFINQIADEYDPTFKNVVVYGTNEYPLFISRDIRDILDIEESVFRRNIKKFRTHEILKKCKVQLKTKRGDTTYMQNRDDVVMLTKFGIYHAMFISDKPVAQIFQDFVFIVLHKLEMDKMVKLEDAKKELNKSIEKLSDERDSLLVKTHFYREENNRLATLEQQVATVEDYALEGTPEHKLVLLLKKKFFQKTPLYIINPDYVNLKYVIKRKLRTRKAVERKENSDEEFLEQFAEPQEPRELQEVKEDELSLEDAIFRYNLLEYELPYNEVYSQDLRNYSDMDFYYYIPAFKSKAERNPEIFHYVGDIEVLDKTHLNAIRNYFNTRKTCVTKVKYAYKTNYENIVSVLRDQVSAELFNLTHAAS